MCFCVGTSGFVLFSSDLRVFFFSCFRADVFRRRLYRIFTGDSLFRYVGFTVVMCGIYSREAWFVFCFVFRCCFVLFFRFICLVFMLRGVI